MEVPAKVDYKTMRMVILGTIGVEFNSAEWQAYLQFVRIIKGDKYGRSD